MPTISIDDKHLEGLPDLQDTRALLDHVTEYLTPKDPEGNTINTSVKNRISSERIHFYKRGISASLSKNQLRGKNYEINRIARSLYRALPDILENAKPIEGSYEENTKLDSKSHIAGYETYSANIHFKGQVYQVDIGVDVPIKREDGKPIRGKGYYFHHITNIKKVD